MAKLLKLPSRRQLVDRLLHLIEFNPPFIFLCGKTGSGRATLCGSLLGKRPAKLAGELWALCRPNDTLDTFHNLAILQSDNDGWCRSQKAALKGRVMPALEPEVPPLSAPEQRIFLYEKAKALKIPTALLPKAQVEAILNAANGHPSAIM